MTEVDPSVAVEMCRAIVGTICPFPPVLGGECKRNAASKCSIYPLEVVAQLPAPARSKEQPFRYLNSVGGLYLNSVLTHY